jgi:hypothetical protein
LQIIEPKPTKYLLLAAALLAAAPAAAVTNLVVNGDFSAGNTGFTNGYANKAANDGVPLDEGQYQIDTNALNTHFAWTDLADNTGDAAGLYLVANGSGDGATVWQQTINVASNTTYSFGAFIADVCCNDIGAGSRGFPPSFTFEYIGNNTGAAPLASFTPTTFGIWESVGARFNSAGNTSLTLRITNLNAVANGNDLGLDDISLTAVPEPTTWAMMLAGFGLVGFSMRRRNRAVAA